MRRILLTALIGLPLCGLPALTGCDREVAHEKSVDVKDNGTTVTKEKKVTESPNGTINKTETKDVDHPANP